MSLVHPPFDDPAEEAEYQKFKRFWTRLQWESNARKIEYQLALSERDIFCGAEGPPEASSTCRVRPGHGPEVEHEDDSGGTWPV